MHVFKVVKEPYGWAVRMDEAMSTPFWSRELAVQEANCLCDELRSHGVLAEVIVEGGDPSDAITGGGRVAASFLGARLKNRRPRRAL
ncbi:MAG: hypothetical protein ACOY5Y_11875 [Pseudomonadota bacterium]